MEYNVVFVTDRNFYIPTVVAIQSFIDSQPTNNRKCCINIMYKDLSEKQITLLKKMQMRYVTINTIDVTEKYKALDISKLENHLCTAKISALLKFEIANLFADLDTILYLDGDIVVKDDISSIFELELGDNYAGGVRDCGVATYNRKAHEHLNLNFDKYINTGVMLLNLKKMREDNLRDKLYKVKYESGDKTKMDQNIFNIVFDDKVVLLPLKYNCTFPNDYLEHCFGKLEIETLNRVHGGQYKSWEEVHKDAAIIHYSAPIKPWKYSDAIVVGYWDETCKKTFLTDEILRKRDRIHLDLLKRFCKGHRSVLVVRTIINLKVKGFASTLGKIKKYITVKGK